MRLPVTVLSAALLVSSAGMTIATGGDHAAGSATKVQATTMTDTQIRQPPEAQGYTDVRSRERYKDHMVVTAAKDGKPEKLAVNPQSGQVTPDTGDDD